MDEKHRFNEAIHKIRQGIDRLKAYGMIDAPTFQQISIQIVNECQAQINEANKEIRKLEDKIVMETGRRKGAEINMLVMGRLLDQTATRYEANKVQEEEQDKIEADATNPESKRFETVSAALDKPAPKPKPKPKAEPKPRAEPKTRRRRASRKTK